MKTTYRMFTGLVVLAMLLAVVAGSLSTQPARAQLDSGCVPLSAAEQVEFKALADKKAGGLNGPDYARFLELSVRQECGASLSNSGASGIEVVSDYTFAQTSGTYTAITGGSTLGVATNDDTLFPNLDIGFSFTYDGNPYTKAAVCSNGYIIMGLTTGTSCATYTPISSTTYNNLISGLGRDLQGNTTTGELRYQTLGSAPNRTLTVQWTSYRKYNAIGDNFNFQITLYETTNVIEVKYGAFTVNATSATSQVGLRGATNADFNNRTTTTNWAASTAGGTNAATMTLSSTVFPASGQTYTWTPLVAGTPPNCASPSSPANGATGVYVGSNLTWVSGGGAPTGYRISYGTDTPPTNIANNVDLGLVTTYDPAANMAFLTTYYWQIVPYNANGDATACPIWSFTSEPDPTVLSFPYSQNFDGATVPGWTQENTNGDAYVWALQTTYRRGTSGNGVAVRYNTSIAMNDWLFTPALQMVGGVTYGVRFFYRAASTSWPERMEIKWGTAATSAAMTNGPIFDDPLINFIVMKEGVATFTPPADGIYYVGFHGYSLADELYLVVDDVTLYVSPNTWSWTGATDTNWFVGGNWEGNIVPGELDDVQIPAGALNMPDIGTSSEASYGRVLNLTVDNTATFTLQTTHNLKVNGTLTNNGTLAQTRNVLAGTLTEFLRIMNVAASADAYHGVDITSASLAMGNTTVEIDGNQAACTTNVGDALLKRCFTITPTITDTATIKFWFTEAERNGQDSSLLKLWHYGPPWAQVGDTYTYSEAAPVCASGTPAGSACWLQALNISTYSPFGLGSGVVPTAVTLKVFGAAGSAVPVALVGLLAVIALGGAIVWRRKN